MRPLSTRLNPRTEKETILTMISDAERAGKETAIVYRDKSYVVIYSTGITMLEELGKIECKSVNGGHRPTIGKQSGRKLFSEVLKESPLLPKFKEVCNSGKTPAEIRKWAEAQPEFADCYVPADLRTIRKKHGCSGAHGGIRENRGEIAYTVAGRGKKWREAV